MTGIRCPNCHGETGVSDSRGGDGYVRRRRRCKSGCGWESQTTYESPAGQKRLVSQREAERMGELLSEFHQHLAALNETWEEINTLYFDG